MRVRCSQIAEEKSARPRGWGGLRFSVRLAVLVAASGVCVPARAQAQPVRPEVWMMPPYLDGRSFRELFAHPDQWPNTRGRIDVLGCTDLQTKTFSDDELRAWFALLRGWNLKFAMEVGAIKEWGRTGEKAFAAERPLWERVQRMGGSIYAVAMDEPWVCCRQHIKESDAYAVEETANYIALVRRQFPDVRVGDIETYPSIPATNHVWWIDALNRRLAEKGVRGLDFYRLDVDWVSFLVLENSSWRDVKAVEQACRKRGLPFGLIYWASGFPAMRRRGLASDETWYTGVMQQGYAYAFVGGAPDQVVVESWVQAPERCLPETGDFTFARSVNDFVSKFVGAGK